MTRGVIALADTIRPSAAQAVSLSGTRLEVVMDNGRQAGRRPKP